MEKDDDHHQTSPSEFALAVTRIAVAQICQSVGFREAQRSALEALTDVAARHLRAAAKSAAASANSSGRTQSNLYDVVCSLEALASVQGFSGASNVDQTLLASSTLTDLAKFVKHTDEIPFAKPILRRSPPQKSVASQPNSASIVGFSHIPRWLPPIPDMEAGFDDAEAIYKSWVTSSGSCGRSPTTMSSMGDTSKSFTQASTPGTTIATTAATTAKTESKLHFLSVMRCYESDMNKESEVQVRLD
ncbi:transcription initiation factor TFIID subunit 8 [Actinidia eriantha]|uniref:transcription initiation factor TFIID subunit 8 n=1 Tax=Actinidia eriantha TaxID=165200 RepID=UPI00258BE008|nr:transcription initiation factor TFIID subunit 8 [Actinidia eriantha]